MRNGMWTKGLVFGIIMLFVGASVTPSISRDIEKNLVLNQNNATSSVSTTDWWPMFHHDLSHSGYSTSTAPDTNNTLWNISTGGGVFYPVVANGRVYAGSWNHNVYCLNADSGAIIWTYDAGNLVRSPVVANGKVYVGSMDRKVYCLNAENGMKIWDYMTGSYIYSSPTVSDGKVYIGSNDYKVYCLNADTGEKIWDYSTYGNVESSPAIYDGKIYVGSWDCKLYCLNAETGEKIWSYSSGSGAVRSSPAVVNGKVYFGSGNNKVYCLNASSGTVIWNYTTNAQIYSSPAVAYGKIYIGSWDDNLYCLNAETGEKIWSYLTSGSIWSSPAVANGKVYIGSLGGVSDFYGKVYCLNAETGAAIWDYTTDDWVWSSPAIAEGKVYVGSYNGTVYCFGGGNQPPTCSIELQKNGIQINEIAVGELFDIYVGNSIGDIESVRFLSDENQNGVIDPGFIWTKSYGWEVSEDDWNAGIKTIEWTFYSPGIKEVWAEITTNDGKIYDSANVHAGILSIVLKTYGSFLYNPVTSNWYRDIGGYAYFFPCSNDGALPIEVTVKYDGEPLENAFVTIFDLDLRYTLGKTNSEGKVNGLYPILNPLKEIWDNKLVNVNKEQIDLDFGFYLLYKSELYSQYYKTLSADDVSWLLLNSLINNFLMPDISDLLGTPFGKTVTALIQFIFDSIDFSIEHLEYNPMAGDVIGWDIYEYTAENVETDYVLHEYIQRNGVDIINKITWINQVGIEPYLYVGIACPVELRIYDSNGQMTGVKDGIQSVDIENSTFINESIFIFHPLGLYKYDIAGVENGSYNITIVYSERGNITEFNGYTIPIHKNEIHTFSINWAALSQGEKGVTVQIDNDGDGVFEQNITTDDTFQFPNASFIYLPETPYTNQLVFFNASSSFDSDGYITNWTWDFGDGRTSALQNPMHKYADDGTYHVTLTVTDDDGASDSLSKDVIVSAAFVADAHGPYRGSKDVPISFTGSASGGKTPYNWYWDFGDGNTSTQQNPSHAYALTDVFTVSLRVTDADSVSVTDTTSATVLTGLVAITGGPYSGYTKMDIRFNGSAVGGVPPYYFSWDLDDDGEYDDAYGNMVYNSWEYTGVYNINLEVRDTQWNYNIDTTQVTVRTNNTTPKKPSQPFGQIKGKSGVEYSYTTSTIDPEGDQVYYLWDWGDGINSGWLGPYNSGVAISTNHNWTVKGSYSIKVKAKDMHGAESPWSDPLPITMPYSYDKPILQFLEWLFQRFPNTFPRLRQLMGY